MFIENLFGNVFGIIWLIIFLVAILALIFWVILKKEKEIVLEEKVEESNDEVVEEKEEVRTIWPTPVMKKEVSEQTKKENVSNNDYEILESDDGFFRVRKVGTERTLRKFSTRVEAENFIEKRGLKHD